MDFVERLFGIYPDGGSGAAEALILAAIFSVCAAPFLSRRLRRRRRS